MRCPECDHSFSFMESLRIRNPVRFTCPACKTDLTIGPLGYLFTAAGCTLGLLIALYAGVRYRAGEWTLIESIGVLSVFLVVIFPVLDYASSRLVTLRRRT